MGDWFLRGGWLLGALLTLAAVSWLRAQDTAPTAGQSGVIKAEVRIVLVDVVVTQGKGEPVPGLHK